MKEKTLSVNEQIELARKSGYNEACYICQKKIKRLKEELKERGRQWGYGGRSYRTAPKKILIDAITQDIDAIFGDKKESKESGE